MEQQDYITLIVKQLSNDILADEQRLLDEWLSASEENQRIAAEFREAWESAPESVSQPLIPDLDASFGRMLNRLNKKQTPTPVVRLWPRYAVRSAATLALLVSGWWAFQQFGPESPQMITINTGDLPKKDVTLPDGSTVLLRKGSSLQYPTDFTASNRQVSLKGEAYFDVKHDPDHHFWVNMPNNEKVEVLGTSFFLKPTDSTTLVMVKEGKVRYQPKPGNGNDIQVASHQFAVYNAQAGRLSTHNTTTFNAFAWYQDGLAFESTPISQVLKDIESYYGIKAEVANKEMLNCTYTSTVVKGTAFDVLNALSKVFSFKISNPSPEIYVLEGGTCL